MSNLRLQLWNKIHALPVLLPSILSVSRILAAPVLWNLLAVGNHLAFPLYFVACFTDLLDGKTARLFNASTPIGGIIDVSADYILLTVGFTYYISIGLVSPLLLVLMTVSVGYYLNTACTSIQCLVGKHVGTILYALLGFMIISPYKSTGVIVSIIGGGYILGSIISRSIKLFSLKNINLFHVNQIIHLVKFILQYVR